MLVPNLVAISAIILPGICFRFEIPPPPPPPPHILHEATTKEINPLFKTQKYYYKPKTLHILGPKQNQ